MRVLIAGASGLIGTSLTTRLRGSGHEVIRLVRREERAGDERRWDPPAGEIADGALDGVDAVVNLAGAPLLPGRWSAARKQVLLDSRVEPTEVLAEAVAEHGIPVLVNASAVGYYGPHGDEPLPEDTPPGDDFLARVCVVWEREAQAAEELGMRVVLVRTGVVLDKDGGALGKMLPFFKAGVGGPVAGGDQLMPWVHADDVAGIYLRAIDDASWSGPVNATAPQPVTNKAFSKALGRALKRPAIAPVPAFAIQLLYGDMSEIVTKGQNAVPARTLELGYRHVHPDLDEALRSAVGSD